MKRFRILAVVLGLAAYAVAFYVTPLPSVCNDAGQSLRRGELVAQLLLLPDKWLLPNWFGTPPDFTLLDRLPVVLAAGAILAWASVVGWLLMRLCRADRGLSTAEIATFATAVGLSALSTWVLLLGLFGIMDRIWMVVVPALLLIPLSLWERVRVRASRSRDNPSSPLPETPPSPPAPLPTNLRSVPGEGRLTLSPRWLWLAVPFVLAILLATVLPPLDFDVREYHLQAPKEFFQQGRITFLPHNVYANMAMGAEMLSLLAMLITGDWWLGALAGKTVIAAFTPLTALALYLAGKRLFTPSAGIVAALVYISVPWVVSIASSGLIESASACYLFMAVYALLLWRQAVADKELPSPGTDRRLVGRGAEGEGDYVALPAQPPVRSTHPTSLLLLAGYLAGAAVATKYPAALFVLLPLAAWVALVRILGISCHRDKPTRCNGWASPTGSNSMTATLVSAKYTAVFLLAATIACGLWFGKNWALTGNPTYPLLYEVFDGKTWSAEKERQWNRVHRPHDFSAATLTKDIARVALTSEWLSPLLVPLALLAFVGSGGRARWWLLAYIGFVIAVWWLFTHRIDRFWIPVLPVVAFLAGVGACWSSERWWRWLLAAMLVVVLGTNFLVAAAGQGNAWFVGLARLRNDPNWIGPWHAYFNRQADDARLLCVGDAAVFDLKPFTLYNTCFDDCIFEKLVKNKTTAQIRTELATQHINYVYVDWGEISRYRKPGNYGFTDFVQPEVFDRLVAEGLLEPLPPIEGRAGRAYRVKR